MRRITNTDLRCKKRRGVTAVEVAFTLPIFMLFLGALMEFNHCFMVSHMLKAAAKSGARFGSTEGGTAQQVQSRVQQIIGAAFPAGKATVIVRDASVFDTPGVNPTTINYSNLPSVDLTTIEAGHLFVVQVSVPYNQVALLPPFWVMNRTVTGQSVIRHE